MNGLDGKTAVVTGAGSGIGRASALRFAEEGANVVVADIAETTGRETVDCIEDATGDFRRLQRFVDGSETIPNHQRQIAPSSQLAIPLNRGAKHHDGVSKISVL